MNTKQLTGNAGVFYACYRLSLLGWNALPTNRNARGPDIILVNEEKKIGIQVKTLSGESDIPMGSNYEDPSVDYWIILLNARKSERPNAYIISKSDILAGVSVCKQGNNSSKNLIYHDNPKKDGTTVYWINKNFLIKGNHNYLDAWQNFI